jgi:hypothetical protein
MIVVARAVLAVALLGTAGCRHTMTVSARVRDPRAVQVDQPDGDLIVERGTAGSTDVLCFTCATVRRRELVTDGGGITTTLPREYALEKPILEKTAGGYRIRFFYFDSTKVMHKRRLVGSVGLEVPRDDLLELRERRRPDRVTGAIFTPLGLAASIGGVLILSVLSSSDSTGKQVLVGSFGGAFLLSGLVMLSVGAFELFGSTDERVIVAPPGDPAPY